MALSNSNPDETIRIGSKQLLVAGMATMPSRIDSFELALNSILPQVDRLFVFLDRFDEPYISGDPRVIILQSQQFGDLRANGKLLGLTMTGPDSYYFCVDDDIIYPHDYVEKMTNFIRANGDGIAATVHGSLLKPDLENYLTDRRILHRSHPLTKPQALHVSGTCTTAFSTNCLRFDVREWQTTNMVDLNFARECKQRNIPRLAIPRTENWVQCIAEHQADSIFTRLKEEHTTQTRMARALLDLDQ